MDNAQAIVWAAFISGVSGFVLSVFVAWSKRADAASTLTGAALELYETARADIAILKTEVAKLQQENITVKAEMKQLETQLDIARETIE